MNFTHLSDEELHIQTIAASKNEKSATLLLLEHLAEVDARRLYAKKGQSSLWYYVHKKLHYSENQTSERVNAMRLMVKVPEVKKELEAGNLSLTTVVKLAAHVKRENCELPHTLNLLQEVAQKSTREVERVLAGESNAPSRPDTVRVITKTTTRITLDVDQKFLDLMKRVQELAGHSGSTPQELFKISMESLIKRKEIKTGAKRTTCASSGIANQTHSQEKNPLQKNSRYIPMHIKNKIRIRSGDQCEYTESSLFAHLPTISSHEQPERCSSKTNLEFDHIIPHALGGETSLENLRHYCSTHNRLAAIHFFGKEKMQTYFKL